MDKKRKLRPSILDDFLKEIIYFKNIGFSFANIADWLKQNKKITTTRQNVALFYQKRKDLK